MTSRYRLFGLTIDSELPLAGLAPAPDDAATDVSVRRGVLGPDEPGLITSEVGSFAVRGGREIVVDALADTPERNVLTYLLGSAMGMLLHQRGLFPLHANAVALEGRVFAIAGESGAGKSTLAAWFVREGMALVGDDVLALKVTDDGVLALPGLPHVRMWRDTLASFGMTSDGLQPSFVDDHYDKWDLPIPAAGLSSDELPLVAIYVLTDGAKIDIRQVSGAEAVRALFDHTYRGDYVEVVGASASHWQAVAAVAKSVLVFQLQRPRDLAQLRTLGCAVLAHARGEAVR